MSASMTAAMCLDFAMAGDRLDPNGSASPTARKPSALRIVCAPSDASALRRRMEALVQRGYREQFGAELAHFMPDLLGGFDASNALVAVIGARSGGAEPLFLEQYLDAPIETAIGRAVGHDVARERVVELGNLVTSPTAVAPAFFWAVLAWAHVRGYAWLAFTGTRTLRILLRRMGAEMLELGTARAERLQEPPESWGAYYHHDPRVVAAPVAALCALPGAASRSLGADLTAEVEDSTGAPEVTR